MKTNLQLVPQPEPKEPKEPPMFGEVYVRFFGQIYEYDPAGYIRRNVNKVVSGLLFVAGIYTGWVVLNGVYLLVTR